MTFKLELLWIVILLNYRPGAVHGGVVGHGAGTWGLVLSVGSTILSWRVRLNIAVSRISRRNILLRRLNTLLRRCNIINPV